MNQTRRNFFKTVAATAASAVAVGVAPRVVAKPLRILMYKGVPFVYQPDLGSCGRWDNYYTNHSHDLLVTMDNAMRTKLSKATEELEFTPPIK